MVEGKGAAERLSACVRRDYTPGEEDVAVVERRGRFPCLRGIRCSAGCALRTDAYSPALRVRCRSHLARVQCPPGLSLPRPLSPAAKMSLAVDGAWRACVRSVHAEAPSWLMRCQCPRRVERRSAYRVSRARTAHRAYEGSADTSRHGLPVRTYLGTHGGRRRARPTGTCETWCSSASTAISRRRTWLENPLAIKSGRRDAEDSE